MSEVAKPSTFDSPLRYYGWLLLLYTLNHGWVLLLSGAIFWDDWILYGAKEATVISLFDQHGSAWWYHFGWVHVLLLKAGPWVFRVLTFVLMFGAGIALDRVLRHFGFISPRMRFVIVLLFLALPLYWGRLALINIHYTICYFLFFLAWAGMRKHRVMSLALFFLSFSTNSLLVFFVIPFADLCFGGLRKGHHPNSILRAIVRNMDFAILPFFYFAAKNIWYRPHGLYAGYNEDYSARDLPHQLIVQWNDFVRTLAEFITVFRVSRGTTLTLQFVGSVLVVAALVALLRVPHTPIRELVQSRLPVVARLVRWLAAGALAMIAGAFPYWVVGKAPTFSDWGSRHQLLLPLGAALVLAACLGATGRIGGRLVTATLCVCTFVNTYAYLTYFGDWNKQRQVIEALRADAQVSTADVVVFIDHSPDFNAQGRRFRFYEWCGILAEAFGEDSRLGTDPADLVRFHSGDLKSSIPFGRYKRFGAVDFSAPLSVVQVSIRPVRPPTTWESIRRFGLPVVAIDVTALEPMSITTFQLSSSFRGYVNRPD